MVEIVKALDGRVTVCVAVFLIGLLRKVWLWYRARQPLDLGEPLPFRRRERSPWR